MKYILFLNENLHENKKPNHKVKPLGYDSLNKN